MSPATLPLPRNDQSAHAETVCRAKQDRARSDDPNISTPKTEQCQCECVSQKTRDADARRRGLVHVRDSPASPAPGGDPSTVETDLLLARRTQVKSLTTHLQVRQTSHALVTRPTNAAKSQFSKRQKLLLTKLTIPSL